MTTLNPVQLAICLLFAAALIISGFLRFSGYEPTLLSGYASLATPLYIAATIGAAFALSAAGVRLHRVGFGFGINLQHILLGLLGVAALQASGEFLSPLLEQVFGQTRDLQRFSGIEGSLAGLAGLLALSWTIAAFGEEIAFRIILMGGLKSALGGGKIAVIIALFVQAVIFGLVHLYQGPVGISSSAVSGLVFGILTIAARGAIWPAAIAHGLNNTIGIVALYLSG